MNKAVLSLAVILSCAAMMVLSSCSSSTDSGTSGSYNAYTTLPGTWKFSTSGMVAFSTPISVSATTVTYMGQEYPAVFDSTKCTGTMNYMVADTSYLHKLTFVMTSKTACTLQEELFANGISRTFIIYQGAKQ